MQYCPDETETQLIKDVIDILDRIDKGTASTETLEARIDEAKKGPLNGAILYAFYHLECLYDIYKSETTNCVDLHPEIPFDEKKSQIRNALNELLKGNVTNFQFFTNKVKLINRHGEKIPVEEICRQDWEYILFKSLEKGEYYLEVERNVSAASWSETKRIDADKAELLIAHPDSDNARKIFEESSSEKF